jgi:hypothetical protein
MPNGKEYSFGETYSPFGSDSMMFTPEAGKSMELAISDWLGDASGWGGSSKDPDKQLEAVLGVFTSSSRTREEQEILYKEKGSKFAMKPGTSLHETGTAADIGSSWFRNWLSEEVEGKPRSEKYGWSQRKYGGTIDPVTGKKKDEVEHHFEYKGTPVKTVEDAIINTLNKYEKEGKIIGGSDGW